MSVTIESLEQIFRDQHKSLTGLAHNITRDSAAAKDVVQDVFLKIWRRKDKIEVSSLTKSYLYKSVVNTSLNFIEKNKRSRRFSNTYDERADPNANLPDMKIIEQELQTEINNAIDDLPPKCRAIFVLSRFEDLKYSEIAIQLEVSVKTVENQMSIALKKLRVQLEPFFSTELLNISISIGMAALMHIITLLVLISLINK